MISASSHLPRNTQGLTTRISHVMIADHVIIFRPEVIVMAACLLPEKNKIPSPVMLNIDVEGMTRGDITQNAIAFARSQGGEPLLLSWYNKNEDTCGPANICHEDAVYWLDYALSRDADLSVVVNDWEYVFLFKKAA